MEPFKLLVFFLFFAHSSWAGDCVAWFKQNNISPNNKNCLDECVVLPADMATYMCSIQCEHDSFWKNKILDGRPKSWEPPTEKSSAWTDEEKEKLQNLLDQLPEVFKKISFNGFYRMQRSSSIGNPGSTSESGLEIVIYNSAFERPEVSIDRVVTHELAHVIFLNFQKNERDNYKNELGWSKFTTGQIRPGTFINSGAKDSPDEDFANNIEYFLFQPEDLKTIVPKAYNWILSKFSKKFKLKEGCLNEKK